MGCSPGRHGPGLWCGWLVTGFAMPRCMRLLVSYRTPFSGHSSTVSHLHVPYRQIFLPGVMPYCVAYGLQEQLVIVHHSDGI